MCKRCGKPLLSAQQEYCYDCQRRSSACEAGHSLWMYDAVSSESIFAYKYDGKRAYADFYSQAVLHFYRDWIESLHVQQLIPVPLSQRKQRQRGFNQAALLAEKIAEGLSLPVNTRGLRRIHSTAPQKKLGKYERGENLKHAFVADARYLQGVRRVLLIDDIYTTGQYGELLCRGVETGRNRESLVSDTLYRRCFLRKSEEIVYILQRSSNQKLCHIFTF